MQSKKRISRTLVFVSVLSIIVLFIFVSCNGRWRKVEQNQYQGKTISEQGLSTFPNIDDEWMKSDPILLFESKSLQEFLKAKKITQITFLSTDGFAYPLKLEEFEATAIIPCADLNSLPGDCKSLNKDHYIQGINQVTFLRTRRNPPCVGITIGGYVLEFDLATGGPCQ